MDHRPSSPPEFVSLPSLPKFQQTSLLHRVRTLERKNFPPSEALDIEAEVKKRNSTLWLALRSDPDASTPLLAYAVVARTKGTALLHKICVDEQYRGQGIAASLLQHVLHQLKGQRCGRVHLWVDESRDVARRLYQSATFSLLQRVPDYYGPGRTGLKMGLSFD